MRQQLKKIIFLFTLFFQADLMANSSFYTSLETSKCQLVYEDEHSNEFSCTGPNGHSFHILDSGGMQIQFDIKHADKKLSVWSAKAPAVVEYRLDDNKNIIGLIVRIYNYRDADNLSIENTSSELYVYAFRDTIKLLARVRTNIEARKVIDNNKK